MNEPQNSTTRKPPPYEDGFQGICTMCANTGQCPACDGDGCGMCEDSGDCPECGGTGFLKDEDDE